MLFMAQIESFGDKFKAVSILHKVRIITRIHVKICQTTFSKLYIFIISHMKDFRTCIITNKSIKDRPMKQQP